jgi:sodium-dependent dicarboxylate transporter 2/3/5
LLKKKKYIHKDKAVILPLSVQESGLSDWLGMQLQSLGGFDPWVLNLIICTVVACATEVTSNTATSTLLMPIMAQTVSCLARWC